MKVLNQTRYEYLEGNYRRLRKRGWVVLLIGIGVGLLLLSIVPVLGIIVLALSSVLGIKDLKEADGYKKGVRGEKMVVNFLQELDDSWWLINDVKITKKGGNIDHILVSPKGVFVLETKNYEGSIRCYQDEWSKRRKHKRKFMPRYFPIGSVSKQAKFEALSLRRFLKMKAKIDIPVTPICVFTNPEVKLKIIRPTVKIIKLKDLVKFLQSTKPERLLKEKEINLISQCILGKIGKNPY